MGRAKGFGYAEFEDRQALIEALSLNESVSMVIYCFVIDSRINICFVICIHVMSMLKVK